MVWHDAMLNVHQQCPPRLINALNDHLRLLGSVTSDVPAPPHLAMSTEVKAASVHRSDQDPRVRGRGHTSHGLVLETANLAIYDESAAIQGRAPEAVVQMLIGTITVDVVDQEAGVLDREDGRKSTVWSYKVALRM
jgi:hypothetical protein